jgi:hypothetical protein
LLAAARGRGFVCQTWRPGRERFGEYYSRIVLEPGLRGWTHSDGDYRAPFPTSSESPPRASAPPVAEGSTWSRRLSDGTTLNVNLSTFEAWRT